MSELTLDVGLAYKLKQARDRLGIPDNADIDWLCQGDNLRKIRNVRLGHTEIVTPEHIIDCDAQPFTPEHLSVLPDNEQLPNRVRGSFRWNKEAQEEALYVSIELRGRKWVSGERLFRELRNVPVLNANALDYLLANPYLIPEKWEGKEPPFWGTIYQDRRGVLWVSGLRWTPGVASPWGRRLRPVYGERYYCDDLAVVAAN